MSVDDLCRLITSRNFLIRIFIPKGDAMTIYTNRPKLLDRMLEHWHRYRNRRTLVEKNSMVVND